jgi:hypothetical protein
MAVSAPSGSVEAFPKEKDLAVFRVPPGAFIKMNEGTWHAGPLFSNAHMDFYNLELSDTNVVRPRGCRGWLASGLLSPQPCPQPQPWRALPASFAPDGPVFLPQVDHNTHV